MGHGVGWVHIFSGGELGGLTLEGTLGPFIREKIRRVLAKTRLR